MLLVLKFKNIWKKSPSILRKKEGECLYQYSKGPPIWDYFYIPSEMEIQLILRTYFSRNL